jgi:hypothetical protein
VSELKLLSKGGIPGALAKAERYRLLAQPWEAESIYHDVLEVEPDNEAALTGLILALTDQLGRHVAGVASKARDVLPKLGNEYDRAYYAGIIAERRAKALLDSHKPGVGGAVYQLLEEAKRWYQQAEAIRPPGNDDALLRWNACIRLAARHPEIAAAPADRHLPYADA